MVCSASNTVDVLEGKPGKLLRCPHEGCGKVYQSSPGYRYHLKSHTPEPRPHLCTCCMKKFKSANGLKYHLRKAHHIEPVLSKLKENLEQASPKARSSLSSDGDNNHFNSYMDQYQRPYINGNYMEHAPGIQSPLVKSPMPINSPLLKSPAGLPSPLIKSEMDNSPYLGNGCSLPPSYCKVDRFGSHYYDKLNGEYPPRASDYPRRYNYGFSRPSSGEFSPYCSRSSLSEYTQQCQQDNEVLRQQCQRLSSSDDYIGHLQRQSSADYPYQSPRSSCDYYSCRVKSEDYSRSHSAEYPSHNSSQGPYLNGGQKDFDLNDSREYLRAPPGRLNGFNSSGGSMQDYSLPCEGGEYPSNLVNNSSSSDCMDHPSPLVEASDMSSCSRHDCQFEESRPSSCEYLSRPGGPYPDKLNHREYSTNNDMVDVSDAFKTPVSVDTSAEQTVPDIVISKCSPLPVDNVSDVASNTKAIRACSDSSNASELSDCVFQNESSMTSPATTSSGNIVLSSASLVAVVSDAVTSPVSTTKESKFFDNVLLRTPPKPLSVRRSSKSKPIPPALVLHPSLSTAKKEDRDSISKKFLGNRLAEFAEFATSPRSPLVQSPLLFSLTPGMLGSDSTPDLLSPLKKYFNFPDKPYLATPTISKAYTNGMTDSPAITTSNSLPPSPFLDNVATPSFLTAQSWPTPVWLCFLEGCLVKFEQDDREFRTTEEIAAYCLTPGGRRRDNMNFYTSGMKIVNIQEEKPSKHTVRDMVQLTFEQIIPGTQRLVAKCPIDHPFFIKGSKGWSSANATESFARYGIPFRTLHVHDIVVPAPQSKSNLTPGNPLSPLVATSGPQVFTFSAMDTASTLSSLTKKSDAPVCHEKVKLAKVTTSFTPIKQESLSDSVDKMKKADKTLESETEIGFTVEDSESPKREDGMPSSPEKDGSSSTLPKENPVPPTDCLGQQNKKPKTSKLNKVNKVTAKAAPKRKRRKKQNNGLPEERRPMNGFMLFAKSMRIELTKFYPGKDNRAISKILGEHWKELGDEKREEFSRMAKELADERMKVNPDCWKRKRRKEKDSSSTPSVAGTSTGETSANASPVTSRTGTPTEHLSDTKEHFIAKKPKTEKNIKPKPEPLQVNSNEAETSLALPVSISQEQYHSDRTLSQNDQCVPPTQIVRYQSPPTQTLRFHSRLDGRDSSMDDNQNELIPLQTQLTRYQSPPTQILRYGSPVEDRSATIDSNHNDLIPATQIPRYQSPPSQIARYQSPPTQIARYQSPVEGRPTRVDGNHNLMLPPSYMNAQTSQLIKQEEDMIVLQ